MAWLILAVMWSFGALLGWNHALDEPWPPRAWLRYRGVRWFGLAILGTILLGLIAHGWDRAGGSALTWGGAFLVAWAANGLRRRKYRRQVGDASRRL